MGDPANRKAIAKLLKVNASYFGKTLEADALSLMVDDLCDLPLADLEKAFASYRRDPKYRVFPMPSQIRFFACPSNEIAPEVLAREIAARICAAVPKFGWPHPFEAQQYIGPEGWSVVQRQGGWCFICENLGSKINISSFQAQLRDQLIGSISVGEHKLEQRVQLGESAAAEQILLGAEIKDLNKI